MSDIPATAWWTLSLAAAVRPSPRAAIGAGVAAGLAILTRPNLVPLALVPALAIGWNRRLVCLLPGVVAGSLAVAAINTYWYGSPTMSGYGALAGTLYRWEFLPANVVGYSRLLIETQTPFIVLAAAAPWLVPRNRALLTCAAFVAAVYLCYAAYLPLPNWWDLRLLLPAFPAAFVLVAVALSGLAKRLPERAGPAAAVAAAALAMSIAIGFARQNGALDASHERRFAEIGTLIDARLPRRAALLSMLHSGSARYYADRLTVRWDLIAPDDLRQAIASLRGAGYEPYFLIDSTEDADFRARFAGRLAAGPGVPVISHQARIHVYEADALLPRAGPGQAFTPP